MMRRFASILGAWALVACSKAALVSPPPPKVESSAFDFSRLARTAHFAYRPEGDGFVGKHGSYRVHADPSGFTVTPASGAAKGAPIRFVTTLHRGGVSLGQGAKAHVEDDGALSIERGEVIERLRDDERGVEQTWTFARPPRGSGDLVVHVDTGGAHPILGASGAHFAPNGALSLAYGHATFVDAAGLRTRVPVRIVDGGLELTVPAETLQVAAWPAVLDPLISPEISWDKTIDVPEMGVEASFDLACGTTNCLFVWASTRRDSGDIFGARVDKSGALLDPRAFVIGARPGRQAAPSVAWDGTSYFVSFGSDDPADSHNASSVTIARVSTTGSVVGATDSAIPRVFARDGLACGGGVCLNVFVEPTGAVRAVRYSSAGAQLDSTPLLLGSAATTDLAEPAVAWGASEFLVVWSDGGRLRTSRVNAAGTVLDTTAKALFSTTGPQSEPAIAASPSGFFVTWSDGAPNSDLRGARVDPANTTSDVTGIVIRKSTTEYEDQSAVTFDGTNWVVSYHATSPSTLSSTVAAVRVSTAGKVLDTTPVVLLSDNFAGETVIASDGASSFVGYFGQREILLRRLDAAAKILDTPAVLVSRSADTQTTPVVSWSGAQWLVAWADYTGPDDQHADVLASRVDAAGKILDPTGIVVHATSGVIEKRVALASDGAGWFAVWEDGRVDPDFHIDLYGTRISAAGAVLDPASIRLTPGVSDSRLPCLDFDGTNYLLGYTNGVKSVLGVRVSKAGALLDSTPYTWLPSPYTDCSIAFDGTNHLVVGAEGSSLPSLANGDVMAVRVAPSGVPLGSPFSISSAPGQQSLPRVAFGGSQYLVTWQDSRSTSTFDVYAARVSTAGAVIDPSGFVVASGAGNQSVPDVVWDGAGFFLAWEDETIGNRDVRAVTVAPNGALHGAELAITASADPEGFPRVSASSKSRRLVVYNHFDPSPSFLSVRARGRLVDGLAGGQACTGASDCLSGICADGVCCDKACTGQCEACNAAGKEGFCTPVIGAPKAPRAACSGPGVGTLCAPRCDGVETTKCTYAPAGTVACSAASCTSGIEKHAALCDGAGACADTPKNCGAYACGATACNTTCSVRADCASGYTCEGSTCVPMPGLGTTCALTSDCAAGLFCVDKVCCGSAACGAGQACNLAKTLGSCRKMPGATCSIDAECAVDWQCVDGVCCDRVCNGQCEACDGSEKGKCLPVLGPPHGARKACDVGGSLCEAMTCDGAKDPTKCVGFAKGTETACSVARCEGEKFYAVTKCTGDGKCAPQVEQSCVPYTCEATGCRTSCSASDHCAAGFTCREGKCQNVGTTCTDDGLSVLGADGIPTSCTPYVCRGGVCVGTCASNADCNIESVCNADGRCVPRPVPAGVEDGGGCAAGPRPLKNGAWSVASLVALSLVRRRRR